MSALRGHCSLVTVTRGQLACFLPRPWGFLCAGVSSQPRQGSGSGLCWDEGVSYHPPSPTPPSLEGPPACSLLPLPTGWGLPVLGPGSVWGCE